MSTLNPSVTFEIRPGERVEIRPLSARDFLRYYKSLSKGIGQDGSIVMSEMASISIDMIDWIWERSTGHKPVLLDTYSIEELQRFFEEFKRVNFPDGVEKKMQSATSILSSICGT